MAFDWDMSGISPIEFDWSAAHEFVLERDGYPGRYYKTLSLKPDSSRI